MLDAIAAGYPTPGHSTLTPAAIGFPVLLRLTQPSPRAEDTGICSNSTLVDWNASEEQAYVSLRQALQEEAEIGEDEEQDRGLNGS
jgi:hypothetical protein